MATSPATAVKPGPAPPPQAPADPLTAYYRGVRQMNLQLAKDRYKQGFKVRTPEYIRGRGTPARGPKTGRARPRREAGRRAASGGAWAEACSETARETGRETGRYAGTETGRGTGRAA